MQREIPAPAHAILYIIVLVAFGVLPPSADICQENRYTQYEDCTSHNIAYVAIWQIGQVLNEFGVAITAVATAVIGYFTYTLWDSNKDHLRHAHRVERAYISGGGPLHVEPKVVEIKSREFGTRQEIQYIRTGNFQLQINNHGKTPGELVKYGINFCEEDRLPDHPDYKFVDRPDWIGPGTQSRPVTNILIPKNLKKPVIYGRFYYHDIFDRRKMHSSGFVLRITETGTDPLLPPNREYTSSD